MRQGDATRPVLERDAVCISQDPVSERMLVLDTWIR